MKQPIAQNRLIGSMPKIGIRPVVDGRGGIRESLEEPTMNMAKSAAALITENVRHANGLPVECVIADTCIGGVAEAAAAEEKFRHEGVGATIHRDPVLVLPNGDDGYRSAVAQSDLGL